MILVLGSINADLVFAVDHLPRPGETVLTPTVSWQSGGKGANQAAAAARAGGETRFVGCVGTDAIADQLLASLQVTGCDIARVRHVAGATGTAAVMVERSGENQIVVAAGANGSVTGEQLAAEDLVPGVTLVCQMEIPPQETALALARAKRAGCRTVLNLAPASPVGDAVLGDVDVLVLNRGEAAMLLGRDDPPQAAARHLAARHHLVCIITLGRDGAVAVGPDGTGWRVATLDVEPVDTVGAGDAFVGVLAASLDGGLDLPAALHRASVAAGLACTRAGATSAMPDAEEIEARLGDLLPARDLGDG